MNLFLSLAPALGLLVLSLPLAALEPLEYVFPEDAGILDVKRDFGARGDGVTDDTAAIQKAVVASLKGNYRNPKAIYLPDGTYLVSDHIRARVTDAPPGEGGWSDGWRGGMYLIGQSRDGVVIQLADNAPGFGNPDKPKAVIVTGSTGHGEKHDSRIGGWGNEAFQNTLNNFTVDTGKGNPGAVAVDFLASNRGGMYDMTLRSGSPDKAGVCGIDMTRPWPGPGMIYNVSVDGFDYGIRQEQMDCSMTFEHITLTNQRVAGIQAIRHPVMSLRKVTSRNTVPVLVSKDSNKAMIAFLDSEFVHPGRDGGAALENQGNLLLRNVRVEGYARAVDSSEKGDSSLDVPPGGVVKQFLSRDPIRLFPGGNALPDLPVKETPRWHSTNLSNWANAADFGAQTGGTAKKFTSMVEFERVDETLDFGWGGGGPGEVGNDNFAIRWTGEILPPADGDYTFHYNFNDRGRLWVDGKLIIDEWEGYHKREYDGSIRLEGGKRVPIRVEYWESGHQAWCRLAWSGPGVEKQIIPSGVLFPTADAEEPRGLTGAYYGNRNPSGLEAVQAAIDSGKEVVYLPNGVYPVKGTLILRGNVKKLVGMEALLSGTVIRVDEGGPDTVFLEHLNDIEVVQNSGRTLVVQRCNMNGLTNTPQGTGDVFLMDNMGGRPYLQTPLNLWARQLNTEYGRKPMLINQGGRVWILGMKTEGMFPSIVNRGGVLECYILYSMTNPKPERSTPFVLNENGTIAVSFADGGHTSFYTKIREVRDGETRNDETWRRETMLYLGGPAGPTPSP
ncbi:MAG: PA14 domain-containing protein [Opitutales bacterium]